MDTQIAQMMNVWVQDWNEKRIDDLMKLYYSHPVLLPADGSRASEQGGVRAYLEKQIGTKMEIHDRSYACFNNTNVPGALVFEDGTYKQSGTGKTVEGHYLVVLIYIPDGPRWVIAKQALTAKPQSQILSRNLDDGTR
jgi:hypothetical protein